MASTRPIFQERAYTEEHYANILLAVLSCALILSMLFLFENGIIV